jgi:hypothetical protein
VTRYDDHLLQVGFGPADRVLLRSTAAVQRLLALLAQPEEPWEPPRGPEAHHALESLREAGLVVSAEEALLDPAGATVHGPGARVSRSRRERAWVRLEAAAGLRVPLVEHARQAGLRLDGGGQHPGGQQPGSQAGGNAVPELPDLVVLATIGPLRRARVDPLMREGIAHLVLTADPTGCEVGPLVVPGRTPCLRCVDAFRTDLDPRHDVVADQLASLGGLWPPDPTATAAGLALAVREICAFLDDPSTVRGATTIRVPADGPPLLREWSRHPDCGCCWGELLLLEP